MRAAFEQAVAGQTFGKVKSCGYAVAFNATADSTFVGSQLDGAAGTFYVEADTSYGTQSRIVVRQSVLSGPNVLDVNFTANGYSFFISGSEIGGSTSHLRPGLDKLVNSFDGSLNPIPNL